jgi:molybdopterin synthase catalytic subunit
MRLLVLFFASTREITGLTKKFYDFPSQTTMSLADLIAALQQEFPQLNVERDQIKFALNKSYCNRDAELKDGDEVALIPPIAGG